MGLLAGSRAFLWAFYIAMEAVNYFLKNQKHGVIKYYFSKLLSIF